MTDANQTALVVYLLHFDRPMGRIQHYIGLTRRDRLGLRMFEHCGEHASAITSRATRLANPFTLAAVFPAESAADERRIKKAGHYNERCPVCRGDLDLEGKRRRFVQRPTIPPGGSWLALGFPPLPEPDPTGPIERGGVD